MNYLWIPIGSFLISIIGAWLLGRLLPKSVNDPALAEKIQTHRARLFLFVFLVVLASAIFWFPWQKADWGLHLAVAIIPFLILMLVWNGIGTMIGDFPKRKILFEERWHLPQFLGNMLRIYFGLTGFWLVLFLTPFAIQASGSFKWLTAGLLFLVLMTWSRRFQWVTSWIVGAEPLNDPGLVARFSAIQEQARAPGTRVLVMGSELGSFSNAFALPAVKQPRILFSRPLLSMLDPEEAAAIFAHEMAHIEDFDRKNLRKLRWAEDLLILAACLPIALIIEFVPGFIALFMLVWLPIVFAFLIFRAKSSQQNETNSDLRAVDLAGDGEALIRGLIKLHGANRMPRRLAVEVERSSTHPSLARRIRDIRDAMKTLGQAGAQEKARDEDAGEDPEKAGNQSEEPHLFWSRESQGELLILEGPRIHWLTLAAADLPVESPDAKDPERLSLLKEKSVRTWSLALSELVELRLIIKRRGPGLRMVDKSGKPRLFPIAEEDLTSLQTVLDRVDTRLSSSKSTAAMELMPIRLWGFTAGILGFFASLQGLITFGEAIWLLIAAIAVLLFPKRSPAFAMGAMAALIGFTRLFFSGDRGWWSSLGWFLLIAMSITGLILLWQTRKRKLDEPDKHALELGHPLRTAFFWILLGSPFLVIYLTVLSGGETLFKLYALGANGKVVFAPLLAAAGALMIGRPVLKLAGSALLILGLLPAFLGSHFFLGKVLKDPLIADVPFVTTTEAPYRLLARTRIEIDQAWGFRLSPGGRRFFAPKPNDAEYLSMEKTFLVADFETERLTIKALDIAFIDDERILALKIFEDKLAIHSFFLEDPDTPVWTLVLPDSEPGGDYSLAVFGKRWRITLGSYSDLTRWISGEIGGDRLDRQNWYHPVKAYHARFPGKDNRCLEVVWGREDPREVFAVFHEFYRPTTIRFRDGERIETLAMSMLSVDVREPLNGDGDLLCMAFAMDRYWLWTVGFDSGLLQPRAQINTSLASHWDGSLLGVLEENAFLLVDPARAKGVRVPLTQRLTWSVALDVRESVIGICHWNENEQGSNVLLLQKPSFPTP